MVHSRENCPLLGLESLTVSAIELVPCERRDFIWSMGTLTVGREKRLTALFWLGTVAL